MANLSMHVDNFLQQCPIYQFMYKNFTIMETFQYM